MTAQSNLTGLQQNDMIQVQRHVLIVSLYASNAVVSCYPQLHDTITGPEAQASGPVLYCDYRLIALVRPARRVLALCFLSFCVGRSARAPVPPARVPPQQDSGGRAGFIGVRAMRLACAQGSNGAPSPSLPWACLALPSRAHGPATPPRKSTRPWACQGAQPAAAAAGDAALDRPVVG